MKNKMKKRLVKILTLVFCMVAVVTTTILPALAAWDESVYTACIEEEYPVTEIRFTSNLELDGISGPYSIGNGDGLWFSLSWRVDECNSTCLCCGEAFGDIEDYSSIMSTTSASLCSNDASWSLSVEDEEVVFTYVYDTNEYPEGYPMADCDKDGYFSIDVRINSDVASGGVIARYSCVSLAYADGAYHVFEESGELTGSELLVITHYPEYGYFNYSTDDITYLESNGVIMVSHPRYSFAAGDVGGSYDSGYSAGYSDGYDEGYDEGYEDARIEFEPGTDTGAEDQYQNGYDDGYSAGYDTGYAEGTADSAGSSAAGIQQGIQQSKFQAYQAFQILKGESPDDLTNLDALFAKEWAAIVGEHVDYGFIKGKDQGYGEGYYDGNKEAGGYSSAFKDVAFAIFEAPVNLVNGMLDFDLFGINVASLCKTLITVSVVAAIVTVLVKFVL